MAYCNEAKAGGCCNGGGGGGCVFVEAVFGGHFSLSLLGGVVEKDGGCMLVFGGFLFFMLSDVCCLRVVYLGCSCG